MLLSHVSFGQTCDEQGITTDPNNPINPEGEPFLNDGDFNWLNEGLWPYRGPSDWEDVLNPFDDSGNPNIDYISVPVEIRDNKPEDGWELVTYRLGYKYLENPLEIPSQVPSSAEYGVSHPSFILYNKYTGLLRVLIFLNRSYLNADYQTANILLKHEAELQGQLQNALFSFSEPIVSSLDNFKTQLQFMSANIVNVDNGIWLIGDFPMAYDPCVCNFSTNLNVTSNLIKKADINLEGTVENTDLVTVTEDESTQEVTPFEDFKEFFGKTPDAVVNGLKKYKELSGYVAQLEKLIGKEKSSKKKQESSSALQKFLNNIFKGSQEVEASSPNNGGLGGLLKSVPKIGAIVGFVDFFISGGKSGSTANKESVTPMAFEANVKMSGTIITTSNGPLIKFATPGSQLNSSNLDREIPMYDEALGVFNLLKSPELEVVTYHPFNSNNGTILQYKLKENLSYALNPAADLEIMEMKATLVISYEPSLFKGNIPDKNLITEACLEPFDDCPFPKPINEKRVNINAGLTFDILDEMGYGIETMTEDFPYDNSFARLNIGYLPIGCFQDASFLLSGVINDRYEQPKIYCKIALTLKREDDPNAQPIDMVITYHTNISFAPDSPENTWAFDTQTSRIIFNSSSNPGAKVYPTPVLLPLGLVYGDGDVIGPGVIEARGPIVIGDGAIILPDTRIVGSAIDLDPAVDIPNNVSLEIGIPEFISTCGSNSHTNFRETDFTSICNNIELYNPEIPSFTSNDETNFFNQDSSSNVNFHLVDIKVFPNPFDDNLNIGYKLLSDSDVKFTLQNSLGQIVFEKNFTQQAGNQLEMINSSDLSNGMYYLTIKTTDSIKTIKVSKQNKQ